MQGKATLFLILFGLCLGCTSEQWVKEYVKGETAGLQEALNRHTADAGKKQEGLEKKQMALEGQVTEMRASLETTDKSTKVEEILNLRSEIEKKFAKLEEMEKDLNRIKESHQLDYTTSDKELADLANQVNDAKRFVDMNVTEVLKAQSRLKDFIIEEVRALRVEHQEYARELEALKSRLQTIESATEKKKPQETEGHGDAMPLQ